MRLLITLIAALVLSGCASTSVSTTSSVFYLPEFKQFQSIRVVSADPQMNNSLEFRHYRQQIEQKFAENGYSIKDNPGDAELIAYVRYGIDEGTTRMVTTPVYGQIGGGPYYSSATVTTPDGPKTYRIHSYTMPTYGIVSTATRAQTRYNRVIAIDIIKADTLDQAEPLKLFEGKATSSGSCGQIVQVFDEMLLAFFTDFPGQSGQPKTIKVQSEIDC